MRPCAYLSRLLPAAVLCLEIASPTASAGPITFTGDPIVTALDVTGGVFLPTSPPTPVGNPPLAADPVLVELPNFGFLEGFRVNGTLDFVATGGTAVLTYVALRPFDVALNELDDLAIFYDVGFWSNLQGTTAMRTRYNAETFVPGIGLTGTGATVPASIPFNPLVSHPIRPLFGTFLNDTGVNFEFQLQAAAGAYMLIQRVEIEFAGLSRDEIIRVDALPVESSIRGGPLIVPDIPEPSTMTLLGLGLAALAWRRRGRAVLGIALLAVGPFARTAQAAPVIVHESVEFLFESGGTHVTNCLGLGCPAVSFEIGPVSGEVLWSVQEKVFYDVSADRTTFTYALFNDTITAAPIGTFGVAHPGIQGVGQAPAGWTFSQSSTAWAWQAIDEAFGVEVGLFLLGFSIELAGLTPIGFDTGAIALTDGETLSSSTWRVSSAVPEPASFVLLTVGLAGAAMKVRGARGGSSS